jgi:hypothetical protein
VQLASSYASTQPPTGGVQYTQSVVPSTTDGTSPTSGGLSDVVLHAIVECNGHKGRTLDYLHRQANEPYQRPDLAAQLANIEWPQVVNLIKDNLPQLKEQIEASTLLELYGLLPQLHKTLTENLSNLDGGEAIKAYMETMTLVQRAVKKDDINININDMRWKLIPRELATIYAKLEASGQLEQVLEHDPDDQAWRESA